MKIESKNNEEEEKYEPEYVPGAQYKLPQVPDNDFYKYRLTGADLLENIEHQLKGEIKVFDTKSGTERWEKKHEPWLNDEGISKIMNILSSQLNKNIFLGNLKHEEIYSRCNALWKSLAKLLFTNYHQYGLDKELRSILIQNILYQVHSGLSRSELGKEADLISTAAQRIEHITQGDQQQRTKSNPLSFIFGRGHK